MSPVDTAKNGKIQLTNEFTAVEVSLDSTANGPRLKVTDLLSEKVTYLDPILVECLTRIPNEIFDAYVLRGQEGGNGGDRESSLRDLT